MCYSCYINVLFMLYQCVTDMFRFNSYLRERHHTVPGCKWPAVRHVNIAWSPVLSNSENGAGRPEGWLLEAPWISCMGSPAGM